MRNLRQMSIISRIAQAYTAGALRGTELNPSELIALRFISRHPGLSQRELGDFLSIDRAAVTRTIIKLEEKGHIRREQDPKDRRINRLYALPSGDQLGQLTGDAESEFYRWLLSSLEESERESLLGTLDKLLETAKAQRRCGFKEVTAAEEEAEE